VISIPQKLGALEKVEKEHEPSSLDVIQQHTYRNNKIEDVQR
jgi:hypothetical protein